jgi:hypothetical protein
LRLVDDNSSSHRAIIRNFGLKWVNSGKIPSTYGKLLSDLFDKRDKADYGEYISTLEKDVSKYVKKVEKFLKKARKIVPVVTFCEILKIINDGLAGNKIVRDFSFDIYCPKSYYHHVRFTFWSPKGRITDKWLEKLLFCTKNTLKSLRVKESDDYVLGFNSRVNQYEEQHLVMLDFDDISSMDYTYFNNEPGFLFRTKNGFHFIGSNLYHIKEWKKRMKKFSKVASRQHYDLSMKRGYATLRITASNRKPYKPVYLGRS